MSADPALTPADSRSAAELDAASDVNLRALNAQLIEKTTLLEMTLGSISQGIFMIGVDGRVNTHNKRVSELLDLPESLLASRPTLQELTMFRTVAAASARRA